MYSLIGALASHGFHDTFESPRNPKFRVRKNTNVRESAHLCYTRRQILARILNDVPENAASNWGTFELFLMAPPAAQLESILSGRMRATRGYRRNY